MREDLIISYPHNPYITSFSQIFMTDEKETSSLKQFVTKFFTNLGAKVIVNENSLEIYNVSPEFEKFYGKKSPYNFIFDSQYKASDNELIEQGNYLLKIMVDFLDKQGKTTLVKINFEDNSEKEIKKRIYLKNCDIEKLISKRKHQFFFRFTFHTSFQYLNEKEKRINEIYVYKNKIINGDLSNYTLSEGKKSEVLIPDIKEPYSLAKEDLKEISRLKLEELSHDLGERLETEIKRIEEHFVKEVEELKKNIERTFKKTGEGDVELELIKQTSELEKDKQRVISIEKQRYSLNVNTKLFNTTLIYYPVFTYDCFLKNNDSKRIIELSFDPLLKKLDSLFCENCKTELDEIHLCNSGHIVCRKCFTKCNSCLKSYCKKCINVTCEICKNQVCKKCAVRCFNCGKMVCSKHINQDKITGRYSCNNCMKRCERCSQKKDPKLFKKSKKTGAEICEDCYRKEMQESTMRGIFK